MDIDALGRFENERSGFTEGRQIGIRVDESLDVARARSGDT